MAFTASTVWEVQTGGDDTNNGGGFDTGVSGFPTDGAATSATTSAPVFTSASYSFVAGDVGAWIYIKAGTNWTFGFYKIASVAGGAATLNATIGTALVGFGASVAGRPSTVTGCATTGSPTGATWGVDYSQSGSAFITFTDMIIGATTTQFTSVLNPVGKNFIGNIISVTSGTGFTVQRVAVVSTSGVTATCDKSLGTAASTGGNGRLGGCFASPGAAGSVGIAGHTYWINAGTYTMTSATANIAAGTFKPTGGSNGTFTWVEGYTTVRGDRAGTRPILKVNAGVSTTVIVDLTTGTYNRCFWITVDGNAQTSSRGISSGTVSYVAHCTGQNCTNSAFVANANNSCATVDCSATGCSTQPAFLTTSGAVGVACVAYSNTVTGFSGADGKWVRCLSYSNSGASSDGFYSGSTRTMMFNCTSWGNGRSGFRSTTGNALVWTNCVAVNNSGYGFDSDATIGFNPILQNCADFNNTSGAYTTTNFSAGLIFGHITLTGDPFTNAAAGDFSLNATSGAGAALRAAGFPSVLPVGLTSNYQDVGVAQHQDAGGSTIIVIDEG